MVKRKRTNKLGVCMVCQKVEAIYNCPKCETVTCSLTCVKQHKKELECDGVRVRTKYVPADRMNELHLLSDYRLLEDIARCVETSVNIRRTVDAPKPEPEENVEPVEAEIERCSEVSEANTDSNVERKRHSEQSKRKRCRKKSRGKKDSEFRKSKTPENSGGDGPQTVKKDKSARIKKRKLMYAQNRLKLILAKQVRKSGIKKRMVLDALMKAAYSRGIVVRFLPDSLKLHRENTSFYLAKEKCIYWRINMSFINAHFSTMSIDQCQETMVLEDLVKDCLQRSRKCKGKREDPLAVYVNVGISKISVLMSADKVLNSQKKFYVLDKGKTLRENFEGKCIVEFPHLCLAIEDCFVVSKVKENVETSFFDVEDFLDSAEEDKDIKQEPAKKKKKRRQNDLGESDRESGELSDSSGESSDDDSDENESGEELYNDNEFRSMYKDLLQTFDTDVSQL